MGEGTHSTSAVTNAGSKRKMTLLLGGTAAAILTAGLLIQFFRAEPGVSAENEAREESPAGQGVARLQGRSSGKPLARVGKTVVTYDQVAAECMDRYGEEVLDTVINRTIIQLACEERGIVVTGDEVNREIVKIAQKFNLTPMNWFQMLKAERNLSEEQYRRDIIWPMLALKKLAGEKVVVTEDDVQQAFVRDYGPRVEARMIMLDNFRRAQDVWEKAKQNPDDFGRLAREHSVESNSRALDGAIPPIRRHSGNENLEDAAFNLQEGELSGIIEVGTPTTKRYVILFCKGHTDPVVSNIDDVRPELYQQLEEEKTQAAVARVFEQLKEETRVDNYVNNTSTGDGNSTAGSEAFPGKIQQTSGTDAGSLRQADGTPPGEAFPPTGPATDR